MERAGIGAERIDLLVVATSTPDHTFPACATAVQRKLGARRAAAFDVQAVCSGFVYALAVANNFMILGQAKTALVIGSETFSRLLDWRDRRTCVLFGDGAGAAVLRAEVGTGTPFDRGVLATHLGSADVAHYASLLRDVMGDGQLTVGDAIEWRDEDGLIVAVVPGASTVTAAVSAEGRLRARLMGVILPALLPLVFFFAFALEEEEAFLAFMGALVALLASVAGTVFVHRREKKKQRKETERIRRQLQRLLTPPE